MYTRTDDPPHIIQEVIDNAADEALAGHATRIDVRVHADDSVSVEDDGRGIPVGLHPEEKVPTVEIVFTRLHAGGKFDKRRTGAYASPAACTASACRSPTRCRKRLEVEVKRDGKVHRIVFAGGDVVGTAEGHRQLRRARERHAGARLARSEVLRLADCLAAGTGALAAHQGGAAAGRQGDASRREGQGAHDAVPGRIPTGLTDYLEELGDGATPVAPIFEGETYLGKPKRRRHASPRAKARPGRSPGTRRAAAWARATST